MELLRALAALTEAPEPAHAEIARVLGLPAAPDAAEHTDVFEFQLYPYASVYLGPEGALGGEARDRVAGFWRALGQTPPPEPDHLAALLALFATLHDYECAEADAPRRLLWRHSRKALFWEHIGCWVFTYTNKMREMAPPFYREWARILERALTLAARDLGQPDAFPRHLRGAPGVPDPRTDGLGLFLDGLLATVRSGMLVTRTDLLRCARDLDVPLRVGDRRFLLRSLLGQDAPATLTWLAGEADRWMDMHDSLRSLSEDIAAFWRRQAGAAGHLLRALAAEAADVQAIGGAVPIP